jgi:hypothetical protein
MSTTMNTIISGPRELSTTTDTFDDITTKLASLSISDDNSDIENITSALQQLSLSECTNTISTTNTASGSASLDSSISISDDSGYFSDSNSTTSEVSSTSSQDSNDFHIRTLEIPGSMDNSIKQLREENTTATAGPLEYRGSQHFYAYKQQLAAKYFSEKKIPRSKGLDTSQSTQTRFPQTPQRRQSQ